MDWVDLGLVGVLFAGIGAVAAHLGRVVREVRRRVKGHQHEWHIGGKDNGVIRRECACGEVKHG